MACLALFLYSIPISNLGTIHVRDHITKYNWLVGLFLAKQMPMFFPFTASIIFLALPLSPHLLIFQFCFSADSLLPLKGILVLSSLFDSLTLFPFHLPTFLYPFQVSLTFLVCLSNLFPLTLVPGPLPSFRAISEVPCWLKHKSRLIRVQLAAARTSSGKH